MLLKLRALRVLRGEKSFSFSFSALRTPRLCGEDVFGLPTLNFVPFVVKSLFLFCSQLCELRASAVNMDSDSAPRRHEGHEGSDGTKHARELILTGENEGNEVFKIVSVISVTSCENSFLFRLPSWRLWREIFFLRALRVLRGKNPDSLSNFVCFVTFVVNTCSIPELLTSCSSW